MASLVANNTFGIDCQAEELLTITDLPQLQAIVRRNSGKNLFVLGGGSNVLFVDSAPGQILLMNNQGIDYQTDSEQVIATVMSGVNWHHLVEDSLAKGFSGLENLALIPGLCGAAPIQNIGAYGVELEQRFIKLRAVDLRTGELEEFDKDRCQFGYRDSFFKTTEGRNYCIWDITLRLDLEFQPVLGHQGLKHLVKQQDTLTAKQVFAEVVRIRQSKLPDPAVLGNAGSFFKNPVLSEDHFQRLKLAYPDIVAYAQDDDTWKIPAAWLIDKAGLKGYRDGPVGTHKKQALVLVNYGGAKGENIIQLAKYIQTQVHKQFAVMLEPEVNIVNETGLVALSDLP